jgi:hypothetical protein
MKFGICFAPAMVLPFVGAAALMTAAAAVADFTQVHTIELRGSGEIADAAAVNAALSALVQKAMSCPSSNMKARMVCVCRLRPEVVSLGRAYSSAITKHSAWNAPNTVVAYVDPRNGHSVGTVFPNVKRQLELCRKN